MQLVSSNPVESATKAFKGISKKNPMRRGKKYVTVVAASVKSPLENLGGAFKGLTQPLIPEAEAIPERVAEAVSKCDNIQDVKVEIVWEPVWNQDMMSEAAKLELGFM